MGASIIHEQESTAQVPGDNYTAKPDWGSTGKRKTRRKACPERARALWPHLSIPETGPVKAIPVPFLSRGHISQEGSIPFIVTEIKAVMMRRWSAKGSKKLPRVVLKPLARAK